MRRSSSSSNHGSKTISLDKKTSSVKFATLNLRVINIGRTVMKNGILNQADKGSDKVIVHDFHEDVKFRMDKSVDYQKVSFIFQQ